MNPAVGRGHFYTVCYLNVLCYLCSHMSTVNPAVGRGLFYTVCYLQCIMLPMLPYVLCEPSCRKRALLHGSYLNVLCYLCCHMSTVNPAVGRGHFYTVCLLNVLCYLCCHMSTVNPAVGRGLFYTVCYLQCIMLPMLPYVLCEPSCRKRALLHGMLP